MSRLTCVAHRASILAAQQSRRAGQAGEKNGARKSEPARGLLIFEFRPLRGVKSAFDMYQITIK